VEQFLHRLFMRLLRNDEFAFRLLVVDVCAFGEIGGFALFEDQAVGIFVAEFTEPQLIGIQDILEARGILCQFSQPMLFS